MAHMCNYSAEFTVVVESRHHLYVCFLCHVHQCWLATVYMYKLGSGYEL